MSINQASVTGRLTKDPVAESTAGGTDVCKFRLAVDGAGGTSNDERKPGFINVTSYGSGAAAAAKRLKKGDMVGVAGSLRYHEWTVVDTDEKRSQIELVGRVEFLNLKNIDNADATAAGTEGDEEAF